MLVSEYYPRSLVTHYKFKFGTTWTFGATAFLNKKGGTEHSTSFPGFSLLLRERTLVAAGHVAPKIWEPKIREGKHTLRKFVLKVTNNNQGTFLGRAQNSSERMLLLDLLVLNTQSDCISFFPGSCSRTVKFLKSTSKRLIQSWQTLSGETLVIFFGFSLMTRLSFLENYTILNN